MTPLRIGVIGLGAIAQIHHLRTLEQRHDLFTLCHVCDLSPTLADRLGARYGADRRTTDWREVCSDPDLDAVLLLHSGSHGSQTRVALQHGLHVLAEKPLCYTIREAEELERLAEDHHLVLQVGYMKSHEAVMDRARLAVEALGDLRVVRHAVWHPSETAQQEHIPLLRFPDPDTRALAAARDENHRLVEEAIGQMPRGLAWFYEELALGSIVHYLAAFRSLFSELPEITTAELWPFDPDTAPAGWGPEDQLPTLGLTGAFGADCRLALTWAWLQRYPEYTEIIEILSPNGGVRVDLPPPYLHNRSAHLTVNALSEGLPSRSHLSGGYEVAFSRELTAFNDAIQRHTATNQARIARDDVRWCQLMTATAASRYGVSLGGEAAGGGRAESETRTRAAGGEMSMT